MIRFNKREQPTLEGKTDIHLFLSAIAPGEQMDTLQRKLADIAAEVTALNMQEKGKGKRPK